jgi:pimeloyl-ACP methyl ester carboxylesterase
VSPVPPSEPKITYEESDRFLDVNGAQIHYNEAGSGPALMCFHGGGPGANAWDNTKYCIDMLSQHFHTMLVDMPGFGHSTKDASPREGEKVDQWHARLISEFIDLKGIDRVNLYGSSNTIPSCARFAIDYPDRVGKLIFQSGGVGGTGSVFHPAPLEGIRMNGFLANAANGTRENYDRYMRIFVPTPELVTDTLIDGRYEHSKIPGHLEARARYGSLGTSDVFAERGKINCPVLVVHGQSDRFISMEASLSNLANIKDVRIHIWGGNTGHFVAYEKADEFSRLVIDFLEH